MRCFGRLSAASQAASKRLSASQMPGPADALQPGTEQRQQAAGEEEGYVGAVARLMLHELVRGRRCAVISAPLSPLSTVRGAAGLGWSSRPGNYMQVMGGRCTGP